MRYTKKELIEHRLKKARETYEQALILAKSNYWNAVVNRLYYACFYAIGAYFIQNDIDAKTHTGVKAIFHKELMKTGKLSIEFGILYNKLFERRLEGDYDDFIDFDDRSVEPLIGEVKVFIDAIDVLIHQG